MHGYEYVIEYLRSEGYRFTEEDKHVFLKYNGQNYIFFKNDSAFVQITQILNTDDIPWEKRLALCNEFNTQKFVIKFTAPEGHDTVWCNYEFIPDENTDASMYDMVFEYINSASDDFFEKISHLHDN